MPSLNEKIRNTIQGFREALPPEMTAQLEQGAGEISALDIVEGALRPVDSAPAFDLAAYGGGRRTLAGYLNSGPLVLTFYRGVWCPYCNLQLKEYHDRLHEITDIGTNIVALTPERPGALDQLKASGAPADIVAGAVTSVGFDVLHDEANALAREYGLVFELPESHRRVLAQIGVDLVAMTGDASVTFPDPATYVIEQSGRIAWAFVPNNYRKRAEVGAIVAALRECKSKQLQEG